MQSIAKLIWNPVCLSWRIDRRTLTNIWFHLISNYFSILSQMQANSQDAAARQWEVIARCIPQPMILCNLVCHDIMQQCLSATWHKQRSTPNLEPYSYLQLTISHLNQQATKLQNSRQAVLRDATPWQPSRAKERRIQSSHWSAHLLWAARPCQSCASCAWLVKKVTNRLKCWSTSSRR